MRSPGPVYFIASDGTRWRVYDRVYERMVGWHAHAPPVPGAAHRVFVPRRGVKHVFEFRGPPPREFTAAVLDAQLRAADAMIAESVDSTSRNPWHVGTSRFAFGVARTTV